VNPDAVEVCDGTDNDCNELIDDDDSGLDTSTQTTWYLDDDDDGYGHDSFTEAACDVPSGYDADSGDCDDNDADINPDATEICDGIDNNCDDAIDDSDTGLDTSTQTTWYVDDDGDGYGDAIDSQQRCNAPSGYVDDSDDCDDNDADISPDATEECDGVDNDCNELIDDDDSGLDTSTQTTWYLDSDGDGFGSDSSTLACDEPSGYDDDSDDCDDGDSSINPVATEACANGIDEDCDGSYSEGCSSNFVNCGGPGAMQPGVSDSCSIGVTAWVDSIYISVGCNDGESGVYTVSFDDGSSETFTGTCGSTHSISGRLTDSMTLTMDSGGGSDGNISFSCCGSGGWGATYY